MAAVIASQFIPLAVDIGKDLIDRIWPDKNVQAKERADALQHLSDLAQQRWQSTLDASEKMDAAQSAVNLVEAQSPSFWKSGARPGALWVCVLAIFNDWVIRPYVHAFAHIDIPPLNSEMLLTLFGALMGLGTLRTIDKLKDKS